MRHQLLVYPPVDLTHKTYESKVRLAQGYKLSAEDIEFFYGHYLPDRSRANEWEASPIRAPNFGGVAPATLVTAGFDPLYDEGNEYAGKLIEAGVAVKHIRMTGLIHGFLGMYGQVAAARQVIEEVSDALRLSLQ